MPYRILADLVALTHLAFVLFVLFGGLLALRWHWVAWFHLPAAAWGAAVEFFGWYCPLTPLENSLRRAAGGGEYAGGFIEHYLLPLLYPATLTRGGQLLMAAVVVVLNAAIYGYLWRMLRS
jgi:hypothetical protein